MERTVFIVSDHTGLTAESVARSLLAQFEGLKFRYVTRPFTDTPAEVAAIVAEVARCAATGHRPIVFSTLANPTLNAQLKTAPALHLDLFQSFLGALETELGQAPTGRVGRFHAIDNSSRYFARIEAVDFALATDDGIGEKSYGQADVILLGVSRAGKTPTCLFLGLQYGLRAANYPLAEDDFEQEQLPAPVRPYRDKLFGLTIDPRRLQQIRTQRKPGSRYASLEQCEYEVHRAERLFKRLSVPYFDTTSASIEEIAATITQSAGLLGPTT